LGVRELGLRRAPLLIHIYRSAHCERRYIPAPPCWCDFVSLAIRGDLYLCDILSARHSAAEIESKRYIENTSGADINATAMMYGPRRFSLASSRLMRVGFL
jgi:hypothetical protein